MADDAVKTLACCSGKSSDCFNRLMVAFVLAALLLSVVYYSLYQTNKPAVRNDTVAKLQQGMSADVVETLIGAPNARQVIDGLETWWFYDSNMADQALEPRDIAHLTITFDHDKKLHEMKYMQR